MSFRLREIAKFEVAYRLRLWSTWLYAAMLTGAPILMMQAVADSPRPLNSPFFIALAVGGVGIIGMLVTAANFGEAATRDIATGTHPLFFTMPVSKLDYLGGRFLGAFAVNALLLLFIPIGLLIGTTMPYDDNPTFGPFSAAAYIQPLLSIALPNLVFTSAILFTVAQRSRLAISAYLAAIALFFVYLISGEFTLSLANRQLGLLLDPFALNVIQFTIGDLAPVAQHTALLGFSGIVFANRVLWLGVGVLTLAWLYRRFRFETALGSRPWAFGWIRRASSAPAREPAPDRESTAVEMPRVKNLERPFDRRTAVRQMLSIANRAFTDILSSRVFQIVLAGAVIIVFAVGWDVGTVIFDTSTWPLTHLVASILRGPAAPAVIVLIALYAGELVWKERDARVAEIADTEPMPTWVPYVGKFIALVGMIVVLQAVLMVAGMLLQAVQGYYRFEPGVYVQFLFGFLLATYILIAALAMVVHVLVNHKHVGHLIVVLFFLTIVSPARFGLRHRLLRYSGDPGWVYSDMNGFGPFVWPFIWLKLYWAAWALLLGVVAVLFYVRGTDSGVRHRLSIARQRFTGGAVRAFGLAALLILTLGGWVFYNTNVLNEYRSEDELTAAAAEYERTFRKYLDAPQPVIVGAQVRVEIHPMRGAVDLSGTYRMVNKTSKPIDSVHVMALRSVDVRSLGFDRPATLVLESRPRQQWRTYGLARPLQPGDSLRLTFDHRYEQRGFPNSGVPTAVTENGAYFDRRWLPMIGYQESFELDEKRERQKHGLPMRLTPTANDSNALQYRSNNRDADRVDMDILIGTADDQVAVTTGTLVRDWSANGRRYFHYRTEEALTFELVPFMSAKYAVAEERWKDVRLKIYYHPTHDFNIERMFRSMKASLEYFTTHFGPFQFKELRIVEFPRYASFARAHPQTIAFSEGSAFLTRIEEDDVDRTFFVTAHETSHQWWGHQVAGARVEGAPLLSETLAMYSSMMVMEQTYGREQVDKFYRFEMDNYLRGRFILPLVPLLRVGDQSVLYYHKGAVAMYTLKEHIGEERVNAALRSYLNKWRDIGPPYPTSLDLYKEFQAVTPDSMKYVLTDLFETITLWNVSVDAASAEQVGPNEYRVTIEVQGKKVRADSTGKETETPMHDLVEIGVFAGNRINEPLGAPLYLQRHRIKSGHQTITVVVKSQPGRVGVDPRHRLIQRSKEEKVVALEMVTPRPGGDLSAWRAEFRTRKRDSSVVTKPLRGL